MTPFPCLLGPRGSVLLLGGWRALLPGGWRGLAPGKWALLLVGGDLLPGGWSGLAPGGWTLLRVSLPSGCVRDSLTAGMCYLSPVPRTQTTGLPWGRGTPWLWGPASLQVHLPRGRRQEASQRPLPTSLTRFPFQPQPGSAPMRLRLQMTQIGGPVLPAIVPLA